MANNFLGLVLYTMIQGLHSELKQLTGMLQVLSSSMLGDTCKRQTNLPT